VRVSQIHWRRDTVHPSLFCGNTVQNTATHCNTLRHTATRCNTMQTKYSISLLNSLPFSLSLSFDSRFHSKRTHPEHTKKWNHDFHYHVVKNQNWYTFPIWFGTARYWKSQSMCDMTPSYVWQDSLMYVTFMSHSRVMHMNSQRSLIYSLIYLIIYVTFTWQDSFVYVTIHVMWQVCHTYEFTRILNILLNIHDIHMARLLHI